MSGGEGIQGLAIKWQSQALYHSLEWALRRVEFPMVMGEDGYMYKACPGCRVIWSRDMMHEVDCDYLEATELIRKLAWIKERKDEQI